MAAVPAVDRTGLEAPRRSRGSGPNSCIGGTAYDGRLLYQGSNDTTIGGVAVPGSVRAVDPATGAFVWKRPLSNIVINTPTVNGSGVLAVGTMDFGSTSNRVYLLYSSTGAVLRTASVLGAGMFSQAVFADDKRPLPDRDRRDDGPAALMVRLTWRCTATKYSNRV